MSSLQGYVDRESPSISSLLRIQTTFASGRVLLVLQDGRSIVVRALGLLSPCVPTRSLEPILQGRALRL
jgi:hypothetical protein